MSTSENPLEENSASVKSKCEVITGKPMGMRELLGEEELKILESLSFDNRNRIATEGDEEDESHKKKGKQRCVVF